MGERWKRLLGAMGIFAALLGIYLFTAPGRIETIDGQWRYDVAKNWLDRGIPEVTDRLLCSTGWQISNPTTGRSYAPYNALASLTPMPLMVLSRGVPGHNAERDRFAFSLTGPVFGALLGAILFLGYGLLGISMRRSLACAAIFCLATLWWPGSLTVLDQNQHATLLLGVVLLAWQSGRRHSVALASLAGLFGGLLVNYQENYGLLLPAVGLAVLATPAEGSPGEGITLSRSMDRAGVRRYITFGLGCSVGVVLFLGFNYLRFGTPVALARFGLSQATQTSIWGNPLAGLLGLAVSPGKGILWFSPPLLLALFGARALWTRAPVLSLVIVGASAIHLLVVIQLKFFGGDWCWGPRYALPVMPLWALAFPLAFAGAGTRTTAAQRCPRGHTLRACPALLAAAGLLVQLMGISLDHQRFFYEHSPIYFDDLDPWVYFKHSQLIDRPQEIVEGIRTGLPAEATRFNPGPDGQETYSPLLPPHPAESRGWMRHFQLFYLPRPWWGWMARVNQEARPVDPAGLLLGCGALLALASVLLANALRSGAAFPAQPRRINDAEDTDPDRLPKAAPALAGSFAGSSTDLQVTGRGRGSE